MKNVPLSIAQILTVIFFAIWATHMDGSAQLNFITMMVFSIFFAVTSKEQK